MKDGYEVSLWSRD